MRCRRSCGLPLDPGQVGQGPANDSALPVEGDRAVHRPRHEPLEPSLVGGLGPRLWWPREHGDDFGCGLGKDADLLADKGPELPRGGCGRAPGPLRFESRVDVACHASRTAATSSSFPENYVVERPLGDVCLLGHVLEIHPVVAMLGKQPRRGANDLGLAPIPPARDTTRHSRAVVVAGRMSEAAVVRSSATEKSLPSRPGTGDASLVNRPSVDEPTDRAVLRRIHPCPTR
jgi:hypothetical protein